MQQPVDTQLSCPSCGSGITVEFRFTKRVVCPYCGQTNYLNPDHQLDPRGPKQVPLMDYGAKVKVGSRGQLEGKAFKVLGQVRYEYEDGFWDEFLLRVEGESQHFWLHEDEGDYALFRTEEAAAVVIPPFPEPTVGNTIQLLGIPLFVTEKRTAKVLGYQGEVPFDIEPGDEASFVDAVAEGRLFSIEYYDDGSAELSIGNPVPYHKLVVD